MYNNDIANWNQKWILWFYYQPSIDDAIAMVQRKWGISIKVVNKFYEFTFHKQNDVIKYESAVSINYSISIPHRIKWKCRYRVLMRKYDKRQEVILHIVQTITVCCLTLVCKCFVFRDTGCSWKLYCNWILVGVKT